MRDQFTVPDLAGTVIGHRCWGLAKTPTGILLVSWGNTLWPPSQPLTATCNHKSHDAPGNDCSCGIYALTPGEGFPYYSYDGPHLPVWGEVHLWGEIIRGTKGYRAQHGYPKSLHLAHKDWKAAEPLEQAYGIKVQLANPYTKGITDGHW